MSRRYYILSALLLLSVFLIFAGRPIYASAEENANICKGVFIDRIDVSGMTKEQAEAAVGEYTEGLKAKGVAITVGENVVYTTMGDMGYQANMDGVIDEALNLGKTGNLIKRYKDLKDIEQGTMVLPLTFSYDKSKITDIVTKDVSAFNIAPIDATVSIKDGKLVYTNHVVGSKINITETTKVVAAAIDNWNQQDIIIDAVIEDDMPKYTKDIVKQCNTVLGTFTTEYASSAWGRAANLANGARLINNTVLYPNETFSAYEQLSPFTKDNGYEVAGAYLQGKVIDSVGGGACQVTTTLYNTVLEAELEVVERQPHSMTISYVDLSRDAAIAGTSKDFKFKNDTDTPILIEATTKNRTITFTIWGHEKRDVKHRTIKYVSEVISTTNPPADVVTKDPTKPTTYQDVTTPAHTGYKAKLWKIIYEDGVQVEKKLVNSSNYRAAARCIIIGTKVDKKDEKDNNEPGANLDQGDASGSAGQDTTETTQDPTNEENQLSVDIGDLDDGNQ